MGLKIMTCKAPPGRQDEWLALYKKYHRPIMDFQIQKGVTISSTLYAAKSHSPGMPWDFVIINVSPPEGEGPKLGMTRAEVLRKFFPTSRTTSKANGGAGS